MPVLPIYMPHHVTFLHDYWHRWAINAWKHRHPVLMMAVMHSFGTLNREGNMFTERNSEEEWIERDYFGSLRWIKKNEKKNKKQLEILTKSDIRNDSFYNLLLQSTDDLQIPYKWQTWKLTRSKFNDHCYGNANATPSIHMAQVQVSSMWCAKWMSLTTSVTLQARERRRQHGKWCTLHTAYHTISYHLSTYAYDLTCNMNLKSADAVAMQCALRI